MNNAVQNFKVLKKKNSNEALELLKKIASQVLPIMRKRGWRITQLCEFFPKNPNLLGTNVNRGFRINIRLRPHYDDTVFLEYNDLLGTMLHELVHIVRGPHDATFYELLNELNDELDELLISGYTGYTPSGGHGYKLGGTVPINAKHQALKAAERRRQIQKIMLPCGGVRLGGAQSDSAREIASGPCSMAAYAAERRLKDQKWCGSLQQPISGNIDDGHGSEVGSNSASVNISNSTGEKASDSAILISSDDDDDDVCSDNCTKIKVDRRRRRRSCSDESPDFSKKRMIEMTATVSGWMCASCTFENDDLVLACTVCLSERTAVDTVSWWTCSQCTLLNKSSLLACDVCGQEKNLGSS